jgi:hypothetical protein
MPVRHRILAMDGGGIRGLLTAALLREIEARRPGFLDQVTLFAGTSTGGLLALGLARGLSPAELVGLYVDHGREVFQRSAWRRLTGLGTLVRARYPLDHLRRVLRGYFGEQRLGDLDRRVLISTFQLDADRRGVRAWKAKFFHNFPEPGSGDRAQGVVDVAIKTSAAPTYFPSHRGFVDGGVVAGNPSMAALAQVLDPRIPEGERGALGEIWLLSLGTGTVHRFIAGGDHDWGQLVWALNGIVEILLDGSVGVPDFQCRQVLGDSRYWRLSPAFPAGEMVPMDGVDRMDLLIRVAEQADLTPTLGWLDQSGWMT